MKIKIQVCIFILCAFHTIRAQEVAQDGDDEIVVLKTSEQIKLDGILDEATWSEPDNVTKFLQYFPSDQVDAEGNTKIQMRFDDEYLYIAATCYSKSNNFNVVDRRRDYGFGANDNITFCFDTYNDQTNSIFFGMNPLGARREGVISNGGRDNADFSNSWDNKWNGAAKIYKNYWICELAIPFRSIRYDANSQKWRFNCYRNDTQHNEFTSWMRIPRERQLMDLSCYSDMVWEEALPKTGRNVSLIPYVSFVGSRDYEDEVQERVETKFNIGGDVKVSLSSALNLDLTVNPDFSQVEVDQQATNLDRFELFFPERRQFFLENADLFSNFGARSANPFFSRRIGISYDTVNEVNVQNTILYGARLSGKLNEKSRIGLINMQTAKQVENDLPSFNYSVLAAEQKVFGASNIAALLINKQAINYDEFGETHNQYNRLAGLEYRLGSKDGIWTGKATYHHVFSPEKEAHPFQQVLFLRRNTSRWRAEWFHMLVGNGYNAEVGFVRRKDILFMSPELGYRIFPKSSAINQHTFNLDLDLTYKLGKDDNEIVRDFGLTDYQLQFQWDIGFRNRSRVDFNIAHSYVKLLDDFDPTQVQEDDIFLQAGEGFKNTLVSFGYRSDARKDLFFRIRPIVGRFYGGLRVGLSGELIYRVSPLGSIGLRYDYNRIDIGGDFELTNLYLLGPKIDITFTNNLFWTTFVQYNNQQANLNINTRLQWRFAPVSDFFLVYTDNYLTDPFDQFASKNRALVAKLTYWFNW